jgi:hypothetical protein
MGLRYSNMQPLKHENQSNLSGVVTMVSPFPSSPYCHYAEVFVTRPMMDTAY